MIQDIKWHHKLELEQLRNEDRPQKRMRKKMKNHLWINYKAKAKWQCLMRDGRWKC